MLESSAIFSRRLLKWYDAHRRDLPWRIGRDEPVERHPDPYHVLVSEAMLQQTQVATVVPYFKRFVAAFPTLAALADSDEQAVLRLWQGLGYYSRARNLRAAARRVVEDFGGQLPATVEALQSLPGVGRYTAGAIASIAFGQKAPIVDGNVARVVCRLDKITADPREKATVQLLWRRAEEILPRQRIGDFNSALMELGATLCTPRSPACGDCPVRRHCEARAAGVQESIPPARKAKAIPHTHRWAFVVHRDGRFLIEQRPAKGRWAGLWQFITRPAELASSPTDALSAAISLKPSKMIALGEVTHALTHRQYTFSAYSCEARDSGRATDQVWVSFEEMERYPMSRPQLKIAQMARNNWPPVDMKEIQ
jgi:A/G-specific adenine glycosylase